MGTGDREWALVTWARLEQGSSEKKKEILGQRMAELLDNLGLGNT